jgi:pimeloyl-ACP methyl ester carboxylesterase
MIMVSLLSSLAAFLLLAVTLGGRIFPVTFARAAAALDRRRCGLALKRCEVMGLAMPYLEGGSGEPLVLLHGLGGQKEHFAHVASELREHYHVFIPDLPGFGNASRDPQADYHIDAQAARVMAFADALGLQRLHLGGNSMGGFIAAQCAALHPDRIASLWLIGAAGVPAPEETAIVRRFKVTGEWPLLIHQPADFEQLLHAVMEHPPSMPYAVRWVLAHRGMADCDLHQRIALQALRESPPLTQRYDHIATPALIVWGSEDRVLHPSGVKAFQALLPNSKVEVMQGCGHAAMLEAPHEAAEDYLRFRAALSAPGPSPA